MVVVGLSSIIVLMSCRNVRFCVGILFQGGLGSAAMSEIELGQSPQPHSVHIGYMRGPDQRQEPDMWEKALSDIDSLLTTSEDDEDTEDIDDDMDGSQYGDDELDHTSFCRCAHRSHHAAAASSQAGAQFDAGISRSARKSAPPPRHGSYRYRVSDSTQHDRTHT